MNQENNLLLQTLKKTLSLKTQREHPITEDPKENSIKEKPKEYPSFVTPIDNSFN